jgi:hypothetical protein
MMEKQNPPIHRRHEPTSPVGAETVVVLNLMILLHKIDSVREQ